MRYTIVFLLLVILSACNNSDIDQNSNEPNTPSTQLPDEQLLDLVQERTFKYFWDFAHPLSGLARERANPAAYGGESPDIVTTGGSGFGIMAILVAIERNWISRAEGLERMLKITNFLSSADRFHGAFPHWYYGHTGRVRPFFREDNGGDIVETSFLIMGLLTARQYFQAETEDEQTLRNQINTLWEAVEWDWYTNNQNILTWHWSPQYNWTINHRIRGYNEALITYILAVSSPTHSVDTEVYHQGWTSGEHFANERLYYQQWSLPLGPDLGGPLFFSHYSFLGLDPRGLQDRYADYWQQNRNHTLINREYCIRNPLGYEGYSAQSWGLTASDNHTGYSAHSPTNDLGVISPTAAISSIVYTPEYSLEAMRHFYTHKDGQLMGEYGFFDAFNDTENWIAEDYLAIDQGPIIVMIENYRSQLLWNLFMSCPEVKEGLRKLNFTSPHL